MKRMVFSYCDRRMVARRSSDRSHWLSGWPPSLRTGMVEPQKKLCWKLQATRMHLNFPCGIIRGALLNFRIPRAVTADISKLPASCCQHTASLLSYEGRRNCFPPRSYMEYLKLPLGCMQHKAWLITRLVYSNEGASGQESSVARFLMQLEDLQIVECGMEEVGALEDGAEAAARLVFP
uniref:Disease resistance protein n=1 Tax=Quercus lobata TaxID=97700 RepID=A0A7N2L3N4_QUELO